MTFLYLVLMFLKLVRGKGAISHSSYLDVLKIRIERKGNDLNRQIYPYLKMITCEKKVYDGEVMV